MSHSIPNSTKQSNIPYGYCHCGCGQLAPISKVNDANRGYVKGEPLRFVKGHQHKARPIRSVAERFWEKVDKRGPDECWEWQATRNRQGYGYLGVIKEDGSYANATASRLSFVWHHGPIPEGKEVCHKCDNPSCVNPNHLYAGTRKENVRDMWERGRAVRTGLPGEKNHRAKLTQGDVEDIFHRLAAGESQKSIAQDKGVDRTHIWRIVKGKNWGHVQESAVSVEDSESLPF